PRPLVQRVADAFWAFVVLGVVGALVIALVVGEGFPLERQATIKVVLFLVGATLIGGVATALRLLYGAEFEEAMRRRRAAKEAKLLCQETRRILRRHSYRIKPDVA